MKKFITTNWEPGLLLTGIDTKSVDGRLIRAGVHSLTNHNAVSASLHGTPGFCEAVPPRSRFTTVCEYEKLMKADGYIVRLYRHKHLTREERALAAHAFVTEYLGVEYPEKGKMILLALPLYNALVDATGWLPPMRLTWCSQLAKYAYEAAKPGCLLRYDGKDKALFTPKTFENRILQGMFEDVTDEFISNS